MYIKLNKSIPDNSESITSSPKNTQEENSAENENINGDHLAQLRSNNCQQHLLGTIAKIPISENSALSFLENKQIHITNETSYEEEKLNNDEISSEDSYPKEQRKKRKLQDLSTSTDTDNKSPKRKQSSLETVSVDNGIFIVDGSSNLSDNSERLGMSSKEESCSPISLSGNQTSENNKEVTRPWRRSPNHIYPEISNNLVAPMKDLEETLGRHLPNSSASRNSSSQEIILRKGYVRSQHSQPAQQSAIQWIGTPQTTLPASTFLRQLYVNRESVIRSGAHPTRPSYYSDVQGTLPTPPSSGTESYTTKTNSESYGIIPNYSSSGSTFMDTCSAMTPPASVSPRDKFHSSTADASAFSEAGISHLRHYVTVDRCADPPLHHLPLKPQVFVHPGSIDTSAYNHSHSSPEQQQLYAHHGFHLYHTSGKSSHHPTNGTSWYPQPNS